MYGELMVDDLMDVFGFKATRTLAYEEALRIAFGWLFFVS